MATKIKERTFATANTVFYNLTPETEGGDKSNMTSILKLDCWNLKLSGIEAHLIMILTTH